MHEYILSEHKMHDMKMREYMYTQSLILTYYERYSYIFFFIAAMQVMKIRATMAITTITTMVTEEKSQMQSQPLQHVAHHLQSIVPIT